MADKSDGRTADLVVPSSGLEETASAPELPLGLLLLMALACGIFVANV
jgi:hypothetical protein